MKIAPLDSYFAKQKLRSAISLLDSLLAGEWPYNDSKEAALLIRVEFEEQLTNLNELDEETDPAIQTATCKQARHVIQKNTGYIGFILRSSNVRNSFEIYHPIKLLANTILGEKYRLIVGSEWSYSPFIYPLLSQRLDRFI